MRDALRSNLDFNDYDLSKLDVSQAQEALAAIHEGEQILSKFAARLEQRLTEIEGAA
jgi:hypothetical protein